MSTLTRRAGRTLAFLILTLLAVAPIHSAAREFTLNGAALELQDVTTNVDVAFAFMRFNRAANEWDVDVSVSNKSGQSISGPVVLLVESFSGTTGPLRADGVSSNQFFFDLSGQISQGLLSEAASSDPRTIGLGFTPGATPKLVTRVYGAAAPVVQALGFARSLNEAGQPLPSVNIQETGPDGSATNATEGEFGVVTLGKSPGNYVWKFSLAGYLPAWRTASLQPNSVEVIPYPRLTPRSSQVFSISPLSGGMATNNGVLVRFSAGSVLQTASLHLTALDGQSLPAFLPQGWSPLQAFWLESNPDPTQPATASLIPWGPINATETAALVKFDAATLAWQTLQLLAGNGPNVVNVSLPGSGVYALVVPDAVPIAPPPAVVGQALASSTVAAPDPSNLVAGGSVTPASSPASTVPQLVTATADVTVTNLAGNLPSGTLLRGEFSEHYLLRDGTTRVPPQFDDFIVGYERPGGTRTDTLHARFPMRPLLLFGPPELNEGVVHVDLFPPGAFTGGILGTNGGLVASGNVRLLAGAGTMARQQLVQLRSLATTNFTDLAGTNFTVAAAFEVALSGVLPGKELSLQMNGAPPSATFVLARVIERNGMFGLEPRERLHSDANGKLVNDEPASGDHLPGLTMAGQYVLLEVEPQQGLVEGIAEDSNGQATGGLPVSIAGQPWLTFSAPDGSFKLLAPAGNETINVSDPATGDTGTGVVVVPPSLTPVTTSVGSVVSSLQVASITPADNSTNVPQVTSVVIHFNRAVNPATLTGNAIELLGTNKEPVAASLSLNLANTTATLLPDASLDPATQFLVLLSTNIADGLGRTLQGKSQFTFSTVPLSVRNPAAQLIIYQPGATNVDTNVLAEIPGYVPGSKNVVVVHGTPGTADPGVPVVVVNEGSGETTTVLSKSDGSFTTEVAGQEQDFISATFVSLNGSRIYVPVNRQLFDDGSVGLYPQGGTLTAQGDGGPVQVTVPPNAIATRTRFKLDSINTNELATQLGGVMPSNGIVAGSALNLHFEGDPPTLPVKVSFPVELTALGYPTNESATNIAAMLATVRNTQDATSFELLSQMSFVPSTGPSPLGSGGGSKDQLKYGSLETFLMLTPLGFASKMFFDHFMVPLIFGPRPVTIEGKVAYIPSDIMETIEAGRQKSAALGEASLGLGLGGSEALGVASQVLFGISAVADFALDAAELAAAKPLGGALVTVHQLSVPDIGPPGRVQQGMVYATSDADGSFLTVAPMAGDQYLASASHPLYRKKLTIPVNPVSFNPLKGNQLSLAGVVFKNFYFSQKAASVTPANLSVASVPVQPAPGQSCVVQINAFQPAAPPRVGVLVTWGTNNLLTGLPVTDAQHSVSGTMTTTNGNTTRWTGTLTANAPIRATLKIVVQGQNGDQDIPSTFYHVDFTGPTPPTPAANIPPPDTNDLHGPLVIETSPVENGFVGEDGEVRIDFNKPIDASVTNNLAGILLSGSDTPVTPIVRLSAGQTRLYVQFPGLAPDTKYFLTLSGPSIRDLGGNALDQKPSTDPADSFTLSFRTPPTATAPLPGLVNGRGAVVSGNRLYALDQAPDGNFLLVYDISKPLQPTRLSRTPLLGAPRDLAVIPQYAYFPNIHADPETNDLVVVVGGDLETRISQAQGETVSVPGQYLWVFTVDADGGTKLIAFPIVSYRVGSAVTKVRWAPPYLVYQEFGSDLQAVSFVNLQELIIGYGSTRPQQDTFPPDGKSGLDKNGDGDYVDPGDTPPLPERVPAEFYGKHQSYVLQNTSQKILDYSVSGGGAILGVTLKSGVRLDNTNHPPLPAMYRTLAFNGRPLNVSEPTNAAVAFGAGAYPRWVSVFNNLTMMSNGVPLVRSVALVSLEPDDDNTQKVAVIDISLPETPHLLNKIPIPDTLLGGPIESISHRPDGLLEVAGAQNLVVLDPGELLNTNVPDGQLHPAIVSLVPSAGAGTRSLGTSDFGVHAVADNGRDLVVQSPPKMFFENVPFRLVNPSVLSGLPEEDLYQLFSDMRRVGSLPPANLKTNLNIGSDLDPPNPALQYYVLVSAPGGSGPTIKLGLEALNSAGRPLSNRGQGFAPVRAESVSTQEAIGQKPRAGCGAPIQALTAYRMSNDPHSPFYNRYFSKPFALIAEQISLTELTRLQNQEDREILSSGHRLRAFIDPVEATNRAIGKFAAQIDTDRKMVYPLTSATAYSLNQSYFPGNNPPPPGDTVKMPGTFGTVCAHSGELRTKATDMVLPSPRMPIVITRQIGNQDTYEGPFGPGWDFNYNQRVTELDPELFPAGLQMPVIVRDTKDDSEIAGSQDVLFRTGTGRIVIFKWISTNMPPEYAQDPLVTQFDYAKYVSDYYLPAKGQGVFELLVKFKDRRFERLTPSGMRYRYAPDGRLETIMDRFPKNRHDLTYDRNGWLVRIDDRSVSSPRYVEFGHFRRQQTDPDFTTGLDMDTANPLLEGKICRVRDYAGADVLYQYNDEGFLTNRLGKVVEGENGGYSGRSHTFYTYNGCQLIGISATERGEPIISIASGNGSSGKPVAQTGDGLGGAVTFQIPVENTAASLANLTTAAGLADGSSTQYSFDKWGHPTAEIVSGKGASATTSNRFDENGLLVYVQHPEGNSETMSYDTNNPVFRSRGNLLTRTVDPGPRGGDGYTERFNYDPSYNLKSGAQTTPDSFTWTYTLSPDKREVSSITYGTAGTETFGYNDNGQLESHTDIRGVQTSAVYDSNTGFTKSRNLGDNTYVYTYGGDYASQLGRPESIGLPEGAPLELKYNANLQKVQVKRGDAIDDFGYDEEGRATYEQQQLGDGKTLVMHRLYDAKGFLMTNIMDGVEVDGSPVSIEYDFTPDPVSRIKTVRYPSGTLQTYDYDSRGNVTNMTLGDYVEQYTFDLNNNVTAVAQGGDVVSTAEYDGLNRPKTTIRKTGAHDETETDTYYPGGESKSRTVSDPQFGEVASQTVDQIDEIGRPVHRTVTGTTISPTYQYTYAPGSETVVGPRMTTTRTWNSAGYRTGFTDPILTEVFHPDGNGRVRQIDRQEDGATYNNFFIYDELDHRTSASDNLGTRFLFEPRLDGQLVAVTNANSHVTTFDNSVLGELLSKRREDGMEFRYRHDPERHTSYTGDPSAGFHFVYDDDFRLANSTLRDGGAFTYTDFDPRKMPQTITFPGGTATLRYDLQKRLTDKTVEYQATTYTLHRTYDALNRVRIATYQQDGSDLNTATYTYDEAGPLLSARFQEDGADFTVRYTYYDDGTRKTIKYPSGVTVTELRDNTGRLKGVSDADGNIISASSWQGNRQPKDVALGSSIDLLNQYDTRGRLTATRATAAGGTAVLTHMRYDYDGANNLKVRQYLHRGGKADAFTYDLGERLSHARVGTIPLSSSSFSVPLLDRTYQYHASGLDYLTSTLSSNLTEDLPAFATNWSAHDAFLLPSVVDGYVRGGADPLGNVTNIELQVRLPGAHGSTPMPAILTHNGNGNLVRVSRADGVVEDNFFQPSGLRYRRRISQDSTVLEDRRFVYDDLGRLLEEYDATGGTNELVARYYYASGDAPVAADFLEPISRALYRYYFLRDNMGSVVAVADEGGRVVERAWYDPFGQPWIEARDTKSPTLRSVVAGTNGTLLVAMSESVGPVTSDPGPGMGIVPFSDHLPDGILTVSMNSSNLAGAVELLPSQPGYPPYSVFKFTPGTPLSETPSDLSAWWPGDSAVLDVSGGHNGFLRGGATSGPGLIQQAFLLNGTSAYIEVPDTPALNVGTNDFTLALWANFTSTNREQVLAEKWSQATRAGWSLVKMPDNRLRLALGDGAGNEVDVDSTPLAITPTNWIHYAIRRQGDGFTIYTNGVAVAYGANSFNLDSASSLKFGSREGTAFFLHGGIDEVTFFGRALTAAEITSVSGGVSVPGPVTVTLNAGMVADEWGNTNDAATVSFAINNQPGTVFYQAEPAPQTAAMPLARSSVGSPFLFHGQYFDYDTGLIYLRARFYDPFSGMFLEPDPLGYAESVNPYAGMRNNPVGVRDPSGLAGFWDFFRRGVRGAEEGGEAASRAGAAERFAERGAAEVRPTDLPASTYTDSPMSVTAQRRSAVTGEGRVFQHERSAEMSPVVWESPPRRTAVLGLEKNLEDPLAHLESMGERPVNFMTRPETGRATTVTEAQEMVAQAMGETGPARIHFGKGIGGERVIGISRPETEVVFNMKGLKGANTMEQVEGGLQRARNFPEDREMPWFFRESGGVRPGVTDFELLEAAQQQKLPYLRMYNGSTPTENPYAAEMTMKALRQTRSWWEGFAR